METIPKFQLKKKKKWWQALLLFLCLMMQEFDNITVSLLFYWAAGLHHMIHILKISAYNFFHSKLVVHQYVKVILISPSLSLIYYVLCVLLFYVPRVQVLKMNIYFNIKKVLWKSEPIGECHGREKKGDVEEVGLEIEGGVAKTLAEGGGGRHVGQQRIGKQRTLLHLEGENESDAWTDRCYYYIIILY